MRGYDDGSVRTVLVVDDEPEIVRILRDYLDRAGFTVLTASDGARQWRWRTVIGPTS